MKIKTKCLFCSFSSASPIEIDMHEKTHKPIYLPVTQEELNHLLQFMITGEERLIDRSLFLRIKQYVNNSNKRVMLE